MRRAVWLRPVLLIVRLALLALLPTQNTFAVSCWSDDDLFALEQTQANSVIYVWSPRMALSVLHADDVAQQARTAGLAFVPVVDGRIPEAEWQSALTRPNSPTPNSGTSLRASQPACAARLAALDAYQHFPSVYLVAGGQLQAQKWTGAMNASTWGKAFMAGLRAALVLPSPSTTFADALPVQSPNLAARVPEMVTEMVTGMGAKMVTEVAAAAAEQNASTVLSAPDSGCVAANQFIALSPELAGRGTDQAVALGAYERVSPDGRFVLRSYSGKDLSAVSLMELPAPTSPATNQAANVLAITQTPLSNEAFPVQGSWRYVVDTNGKHYGFRDLLVRQKQAAPLFQGGMSGFYAASAEVGSIYPLRSSNPVQIRSLSWPNANGDSDLAGDGMLTARTLLVAPEQNRVLADSGTVNLCTGRAYIDGTLYSLPMISVDGQYFSALPQRPVDLVSTMRVFGFGADGKQCLAEQQFASPSGKVTFGFPPPAALAKGQAAPANLVYEYRSQTWWYDSASSTALNLAPVEDPPVDANKPYRKKIMASAFPGLTRDGRVIYAATWQLCKGSTCVDEAGYVAADPYQSNAYQQQLLAAPAGSNNVKKAQACIAVADVLRERAAFANFHGLPLR